jgi:dTDP-4-amino-4,6-dideoxygalactose transaminase
MSKDAWKRFSDDGFKHYQIFYPGYKYNMTDIQASLGIHQLRRVESSWQRRRAIFERYRTELQGLPLILPADAEPDTRHAHHLFSPLVDIGAASVSRDQLIQLLHERNIGTGVHYIALHLHPFYRDEYKYRCGDFPNAEFISERTISLPFSAKLTDDDVQDVITALKEILV